MKLEQRRVRIASGGAQSARQSWPERRSVLVRLSGDGAVGLGEASPLPGYSPDDLDAVESALGAVTPERVAAALQRDDPYAALASVAELVAATLPSARLALETAALDWLSRRRGCSATALLGADGSSRRLAALLTPAPAAELAAAAESFTRQGYRCLKLKLGAPGAEALAAEISAVAAVRERVGPGVALRLDANGAFSVEQLRQAWPALARHDIELFEEPGALPPDFGAAPPLPLGLDESLQGLTPEQAVQRWRDSGARAVVLKPMALGGLTHCFRLARLAQAAGARCVVSHCFDGPIAFAATAALALALPASADSTAHGLAPHAALAGWGSVALPLRSATLEAWSAPGLGLPAELWA